MHAPARLIDAHSHFKPGEKGTFTCRNAYDRVTERTLDNLDYPVSVGTHPWWADQFPERKRNIERLLQHPKVVAMGETGLDLVRGPSFGVQMVAWMSQLEMAAAHQMPLILHAVRSHYQLFPGIRKAKVPALFHGFNGGANLLNRIFEEENSFVSFGPSFFRKPDASRLLLQSPIHRWLLETDASQSTIQYCYDRACEILGLAVEDLSPILEKNARKFFGEKAHPFF
jgi:TatD DNase family protein